LTNKGNGVFPKRRILALEQDSGKGKAACCRQESGVSEAMDGGALARLRREVTSHHQRWRLEEGP